MNALRADSSAEIPAHPPHHVDEAREAGRDEGGVVDPHRLLARKPHHQRRHRDAVIHVGRDQAAAAGAALAVHDQVVALDLDVDAVAGAASRRWRRGGRIPSRATPSGRACASCLRRTTPRPRAPDIRRSSRARARAAPSTPRSAPARTRRSATSSPPSSRRSSSSITAPISRSVANSPVRSGLSMTPSRITSEPGTISPATSGNDAEDGSAGTVIGAGVKFRLAGERDAPAVRAFVLDPHGRAEMAQHPLGVVARRLLLDHHGLARRREAGEQHRGLELRRGRRRLVDDRNRVARAGERERQPPALGDARGPRAHALERIEHAPHRPRAQRGIAVEGRGDRATRDRPDDQAAAGAGIAEIERSGRLREARDPDPVDAPGALSGAFDALRRARASPCRY